MFQGAIATTLTQPLDVLKTRCMNAKPGEFQSSLDLVKYTAKNGPMGFYKVQKTVICEMSSILDFIGIHSSFCPTRSADNSHFCFLRATADELWKVTKMRIKCRVIGMCL